MKKVILCLAVVAAAFSANAQDAKMAVKKFRFGVGVEAALPIGDFQEIAGFGIGGSVQGDYNVDPSLAITLNAGYISFSGKDVTINVAGVNFTTKYPNTGLVPVLAGIQYKFTPQFFASAQLGIAFSTEEDGGSNFTYAPGIGYKFTPNFDALLKYTGYSVKSSGTSGGSASALNTIGLRVAYTF
ncbi:MAG: outer membrane beta-barrel protein [Ferruginibacter sp.]